jgi:hypothetical protein
VDSCCSHTSCATPFDRERRGHSSADRLSARAVRLDAHVAACTTVLSTRAARLRCSLSEQCCSSLCCEEPRPVYFSPGFCRGRGRFRAPELALSQVLRVELMNLGEGLLLFSPRPGLKKSAGLRCRSRGWSLFADSSRSDHGEPLLPWLGRARWEGALLACPRLPPLRACLAGAYPRPRPALAAKHLPSLRRRRSRLIH